MTRVQAKNETQEVLYNDGSVDSALTKSAASMLESVEAYLAEHPDLNGWGQIPARGEHRTKANVKSPQML